MEHSGLRHQESFLVCLPDFFAWFFPELLPGLKFETAQFLGEDEIGYSPGGDIHADGDTLVSIKMQIGMEWVKSFFYWLPLSRRPPNLERLLFHAYCRLYSQYEAFILPIVLYTGPVPQAEPDRAPVEKVLEQYRVFRFQQIELKRFTAIELLDMKSDNPLVWAYLPFTEYESWRRPEILAQSLQGIADSVDGDDGGKLSILSSLVIHSMSLNEVEESLFEIYLNKHTEFEEAKMLYLLREEGIEVGLERGREEGKQATAILHTRKLLEKDMKWGEITEITGITEEILANESPDESG